MTISPLEGPATVVADGTRYRVARSDAPLRPSTIMVEDSQREFAGNRFDVLGGGVLYLGSTVRACYVETLARFRPSARIRQVVANEDAHFVVSGGVPADWRHRRLRIAVRLPFALPFVDVEQPESQEFLTAKIAPQLAALGVDQLDVGLVRGRNRLITRAIASWAYAATDDDGRPLYSGIRYVSRLGNHECWAVFDGTTVLETSRSTIDLEDDALKTTAMAFGLTVF